MLEKLPPTGKLAPWTNAGGQLIPTAEINKLTAQVSSGKIKNWAAIHNFYKKQASLYPEQQLQHALAALQAVYGIHLKKNKAALKTIVAAEYLYQRMDGKRHLRKPGQRLYQSIPQDGVCQPQ